MTNTHTYLQQCDGAIVRLRWSIGAVSFHDLLSELILGLDIALREERKTTENRIWKIDYTWNTESM